MSFSALSGLSKVGVVLGNSLHNTEALKTYSNVVKYTAFWAGHSKSECSSFAGRFKNLFSFLELFATKESQESSKLSSLYKSMTAFAKVRSLSSATNAFIDSCSTLNSTFDGMQLASELKLMGSELVNRVRPFDMGATFFGCAILCVKEFGKFKTLFVNWMWGSASKALEVAQQDANNASNATLEARKKARAMNEGEEKEVAEEEATRLEQALIAANERVAELTTAANEAQSADAPYQLTLNGLNIGKFSSYAGVGGLGLTSTLGNVAIPALAIPSLLTAGTAFTVFSMFLKDLALKQEPDKRPSNVSLFMQRPV